MELKGIHHSSVSNANTRKSVECKEIVEEPLSSRTWHCDIIATPKKVDMHKYDDNYMKVKGNALKNKRVLMESIQKSKAEKVWEKTLSDQFEAKREKNTANSRKFSCLS